MSALDLPSPDYPSRSLEELQVSFSTGDEQALVELLRRYRGPLRGRAEQLMGTYLARTWYDTEDLYQELRLRLWQESSKYDPSQPWITWSFKVLQNLAISMLRKINARIRGGGWSRTDLASVSHILCDEMQAPEQRANLNELSRNVESLLNQLPEDEREMLVLRFYEQWTLKEIGKLMKVDISTAKRKIDRALAKLRLGLGPDGRDGLPERD